MHALYSFFHSRVGTIVAAPAAVAAAVAFCLLANVAYPISDGALVHKWNPGAISAKMGAYAPVASIAAAVCIAALLGYLNKAFNLLRGLTMLQSTIFLCMLTATPALLATFNAGIGVCLVIVLCCILMYGSYGRSGNQRQVFLAFLLLSACTAIDYAFAVYVPVMWLATLQMRIFSLRTVLASLMGIATPWIIFFGFGILSPSDIALPDLLNFSIPASSDLAGITLLCTALFTALVAVVSWLQNVMKIYSYNVQSRAQLGLISVIMPVTILAMCLNLPHAGAFLPTLSMCAALQVAHMFAVIYNQPRSAVAILILTLVYFAIYAWRIIICTLL